ncbi:hypothetical protein [Streptomyces ossamyceticus]|uniref:Secreted protein n=1 Tax=Streptomyces ossamyceticus TaxID=249581 RepID=A0ABV2VCV2_9ACTN
MPRGRHRHSPPLHRLLPPTAIAGVSLVCALGPWVFSGPAVLRVLAALAAATAAVGAAVMRRWDVEAGKRVADLTRARASDEWRHEERVAELETDLEESRELRTKLEHKLRAKRAELANLRNEHAALLRRYATAETERASALEGRRLLEIETTAPEGARELTAGGEDAESTGDASAAAGAGASSGTAGAGAASGTAGVGAASGIVGAARGRAAAQASPVSPQGIPAAGAPWGARGAGADAESAGDAGDDVEDFDDVEDVADAAGVESAEDVAGDGGKPAAGVFSPAGSALWLRANSALERIITQRGVAKGAGRVPGADVAGAEADAGVVAVAAEAEDQDGTEGQDRTEDRTEAGTEARAEDGVSAGAESGADVADADADAAEVAVETEAGGEGDGVAEAEADGAELQGRWDVEDEDQAAARAEAVVESVESVQSVEVGQPGEPGEDGGSGDERASGGVSVDEPVRALSVKDGSGKGGSPEDDPDGPNGGGTRQGRSAEGDAAERVPVVTAEEDDPAGKPGAVDEHEHAAAQPVPAAAPVQAAPVPAQSESSPEPVLPALPAVRPAGHFTVPTAVAVVPAAPQRRTAVEGGFDFFGTQKEADVIEAVQNEDLADVVGQEALALHKAESEAQFKRMDEAARRIGQVIDLTAHDETEQIDLRGLRTAAS